MRAIEVTDAGVNSLVEQKTDGECTSFKQFYLEHESYIRALVYRVGIRDELDDVVQNVFVSVWRQLGKFNKRSSIKTWMARIALNAAYDAFRNGRRQTDLAEVAPNRHDVSKVVEHREILDIAMQSLSWEHRVMVVLCLIEEYSLEEAAAIVKVPVGTAKSRLNRARSAMLKKLESLEVNL